MSFDGSVIHALCNSFNELLTGGKIERIYQHENCEIIIHIRNNRKKFKLLISASGNYPRIHLTDQNYENPLNPPSFCMLLRKHLEGTKILGFSQYKMDRILKMDVLSRDDLGDEVENTLVVEIMGKYSNIILINHQTNRIYDAIKRVNFSMSSVREILPGKDYLIDSISQKRNPLEEKNILISLQENSMQEDTIQNFLMSQYTGISPQMVREICYRAELEPKEFIKNLTLEKKQTFNEIFCKIFEKVKNNEYSPIKILENGEWKDFYILDLIQYDEKEGVDNLNVLIDSFYCTKDHTDRMKNKSHSLRRYIKNELDKTKRKLSYQINEYNEALSRDIYKTYADLISSNLYKTKRGQKILEVENFYDEMKPISIPLNPKLDGPQNATYYYKKYSKLKNAAKLLEDQISQTENNIKYLESVEYSINMADNLSDLSDIREDLQISGFLKTNKKYQQSKKQKAISYQHFETPDGFHIFVGKNNKQNEYLTLKLARKDDLWFHVKSGSGSHVILQNKGSGFSDVSIEIAANLAAKYSSLAHSEHIDVDYTQRKNIKRHPSKKLGLVIYENFSTFHIKQIQENMDILKKVEN